jgi:LDH2 family malate/lactate/ureidoglycolate dehydrogenase
MVYKRKVRLALLYEKTVPKPPEDYVRVEHESLKSFVVEVFNSLDVPKEHGQIVAEALVLADLMGVESHGVQRLSRYTGGIRIGSVNTRANVRILSESASTAFIDGDSGLGQMVAYKAMEMAKKKAEEAGASIVGVRNSHHFGMAGYYVLNAIENNMIGMVMTNSEALVAYTHTLGRSLGTNPIAIGCPTKNPPPILFDAAMGVVPIGKIEVYAKEGKKIPLGWAMGPDGELLTDPHEVLAKKGAILPLGGLGEEMGGHKGAGLALFVDLLSGVLTGSNWGRNVKHTLNKEPANVGHFMLVLDVKRFMPLDQFLENVEKFKQYVKSLHKISHDSEVWVPGEKAWLTMETRKRIGIPIHKNILKELKDESEKTGVEFIVKVLQRTA